MLSEPSSNAVEPSGERFVARRLRDATSVEWPEATAEPAGRSDFGAGTSATASRSANTTRARTVDDEESLSPDRDVRTAPSVPPAQNAVTIAHDVPAPSPRPMSALIDFGILEPYVADAEVTDIFVNGPGQLWVDRGTGAAHHPEFALDETEVRLLATTLIAAGGRHIDEATPCVDVRLLRGIRVHAVLPPISPGGTLLSIRLPRVEPLTVDQLESQGFFELVPLAVVRDLVLRRRNLLLTGAGGSGKTTLLAALLSLAAKTDRIVAIEDVAELQVSHPQFVALEARQANLEGAGEVGLQRLVREALRMRPDRLVLGECRGAEIRDLLGALNTGHDGGAGTLHANSLADVPARLEALGALAGLDASAVARQAVSAIDAVLQIERVAGRRRLVQLGRFELNASDRLAIAVDGHEPKFLG